MKSGSAFQRTRQVWKSARQARWVVFVLFWGLSLGAVLTGSPDSLSWKAAAFFLVAALLITIRKYFQYRRELDFLREFHHLSQTLDDIRLIDSTSPFGHILDAVIRIVGFDRAILFLKDADADVLRAVHAVNLDEKTRAQLVMKRAGGTSLAWKAMESGEATSIQCPPAAREGGDPFPGLLGPSVLGLAPITHGGESLGLLAVDRHASGETITDEDLLQLQVISDQLGITLRNHFLNDEIAGKARLLEAQNSQVQRELTLAKIVQDGVFPRTAPDWPGLEVGMYRKSARVIGGDFFRFLDGCRTGRSKCRTLDCPHCEDRLHWFLIGDVCGKGIPAALVMAVVNCLFKEKVDYFSEPSVVLREVNISLKEYLGAESRFNSSAFLGFYSPVERKFHFANAGHDFPLFYRSSSNSLEELESTGTLLGLFRESDYSGREIDLGPGDRILFFTDGLVELLEEGREEAEGITFLREFFLKRKTLGAQAFIGELEKTISLLRPDPSDDVTACILEVKGGEK